MRYDPKTKVYTIPEEERTRALLYFFGWQGGTIHQLAEATGVAAAELLYREIASTVEMERARGFSAIRTCSRDWRVDRLAPKERGSLPFWQGAIVGFWATGPLDVDTARPC